MHDGTVERHYARSALLDTILDALRESGKDPARLAPSDLAAVDQFHVRGREATVELAQRARPAPGARVLDVGCGLGGSARYLAQAHGCRVVGVDLTQDYVDAANGLAALVGLAEAVEFRRASALALPFDDATFDLVWTEHVQMNVADKQAFYRELARVLAPGGRLAFHDVFQGPGGPARFPVPWAEDASISFLATPDEAREAMAAAGLAVQDWEDRSEASLAWFLALRERAQRKAAPRFGLHLLTGENTGEKFANNVRNLQEARVRVAQGVALKA